MKETDAQGALVSAERHLHTQSWLMAPAGSWPALSVFTGLAKQGLGLGLNPMKHFIRGDETYMPTLRQTQAHLPRAGILRDGLA